MIFSASLWCFFTSSIFMLDHKEARDKLAAVKKKRKEENDQSKEVFGGILGGKDAKDAARAEAKEAREKRETQREEKLEEAKPKQQKLERLRDLAKAAHGRADYATAEKQYTAALEVVDQLAELDIPMAADRATVANNRCATRMMLEKFDDALSDARDVVARVPGNVKAYVRGSKCLAKMGDWGAAEDFASAGMKKVSQSESYEIAQQVEVCRKARKAIYDVEQLVETVPGDREKGRKALALLDLHSLKEQVPVLRLRALVLAGDATQGEEAVQLCAHLKEEDNAPLLRGLAYLLAGERDKAKKALKEGGPMPAEGEEPQTECARIQVQLQKADGLKAKGNAALKFARYETAAEAYEEALGPASCDPKMRAVLLTNLATAERSLDRFAEARKHATAATKADGKYAKAFFRLGQLSLDECRWRDALHNLRKVEQLEPNMQGLDAWVNRAQHAVREEKDRPAHYKELGCRCDATPEEVKKKYRTMARTCHPDKCQDMDRDKAEARFKRLNEANEVLTDSTKRDEYENGSGMCFGGFPGGFQGGHPFMQQQ